MNADFAVQGFRMLRDEYIIIQSLCFFEYSRGMPRASVSADIHIRERFPRAERASAQPTLQCPALDEFFERRAQGTRSFRIRLEVPCISSIRDYPLFLAEFCACYRRCCSHQALFPPIKGCLFCLPSCSLRLRAFLTLRFVSGFNRSVG